MSLTGHPVLPVGALLRAAAAYFAWVFAAGFLLALIRVPLLAPRIGERWAELAEMPVMLAVIWFVAGWRLRVTPGLDRAGQWLGVGFVALILLLLAEAGLVLLQGQSLGAYVASRDPVSGAAYLAALGAFALMPWLRYAR